MKGCHSCEFKAAVDAGKFRDVPWEKVPCASCKLVEGGHAIEYDEDRLDEEAEVSNKESEMKSQDGDGMESMLPVSVMGQVVTGLMTLKPELRDVVAMRYSGLSYPEIAERQGVTMACAEKRHRRAMELWPALREMFPEKVAKRKRRKPHSKREEPHKAHKAQKTGKMGWK